MMDINLNDILEKNEEDVNQIVSSVLSGGNFNVKNEIMNKLPYTRKASINDIVPEEYQQKLMAIGFTMSQCFFMIGDIADDLINSINRERSQQLGKLISKKDIFEAIGFFCHRTARTVRYYWEAAHFFPLEIRDKHDVPFNVYAEARWVDDWEFFLKLADENPMWTASRVRTEYYKLIGQEEPKNPETARAVDDAGAELPLPVEGEQWTGESQTRFKSTVLDKLEHTADDLRDVLNRIPLPNDIRSRIRDVLLEINDISMEIRREV